MSDDDLYAYCATLTRDQCAWEFLRRNPPQYQSDYQQFITTWRALEAEKFRLSSHDRIAPPRLRHAQEPRKRARTLDYDATAAG